MNEINKYKILMTIRYMGDAFFYPFIALYLKHCGLIENQIGLLLSLSPLIGILMNPFFTWICKNPSITKRVLAIISALEGIIIILIAFQTTFVPLLVLVIFLAIFGACHYGLMDALATLYTTTSNKSFSSIRIFGSMAYAIGTVAGGYMIKYLNYQWTFLLATILFIGSAVMYLVLKPIDLEQPKTDRPKYRELFSNKAFYLYASIFILLLSSVYASDHFFSLFLATKGIDEGGYGIIYAYYVVVECITLLILSRLKGRLKAEWLILICCIILFCRQLVNVLPLPPIAIAIGAGFRGLFYGFFLHVAYVYVEHLVGKRLATIGIMTMMLGEAILLFALENLDGIIIHQFGFRPFYLLMMGLAIIAIICQCIRMIRIKAKDQEDVII